MKTPTPAAIVSQRSIAPRDSDSHDSNSTSAPARQSAARKTKIAKSDSSENASKPRDDTKKRVRLKPETREQLLERLRNPPLSLHETSILLRVSRATVRRYADAGRLPCLRTPGGQRRFALRDIEAFYRQLKAKR